MLAWVVGGIALITLTSGCVRLNYSFTLTRAPDWVASWDANGDGRRDLVTSHATGTNLDFFPRGEHGMYSSVPVPSPLAGVKIGGFAVGGFGPDRSDQLAVLDVAQPTRKRILFYSRLGAGATPVAQVPLGDVNATGLSAGDLNGDHYDDIAVVVRQPDVGFGCVTDGCILFVFGGATGPTLSPLSISAGPVEGRKYDPALPSLVDVNRDGKVDVLIPDTATKEIVLVPGAGGGVFDQGAARVLATTAQPPIRVVLVAAGSQQDVLAVFQPASGPKGLAWWENVVPGAPLGEPELFTDAGAAGNEAFFLVLDDGATALGRTDVGQRLEGGCASVADSPGRAQEQVCAGSFLHQDGLAYDAADPPSQLDFGNVRVGDAKTITFSMPFAKNENWRGVKIVPVEESGPPFALDNVVPDTVTGRSFGTCALGVCTFSVTFTPKATGAATGSFKLTTDGTETSARASHFVGGPIVIRLRGVGVIAGAGTKQVGVAEDASKYADDGGKAVYADLKTLGAKVNRWTLVWDPTNPEREFPFLDRAVPVAQKAGIDIIVSAFPAKGSNTGDPVGFCTWLKGVAVRYPYLRRFIVGNEVNATRFWSPQHTDGDPDAGPRSYYAHLSRCYDALKSVSSSIQVIGMGLAPRSVDANSTKPLAFVRAVGKIYKQDTARGGTPIMDAIAVHPYPNPNVNPPPAPDNAKYEDPDFYGIPQLDRVKQAVWDAFHGTAQKTTVDGLPIVIDELGYQSDTTGKPLYTGTENSPIVSEANQAQYHARIVALYACDPTVSDVLLFHLIDETQRNADSNAGGWQSGLEYPDGGRKPSFASVGDAIGLGCTGATVSWKPAGTTSGGTTSAGTAPPLILTSPVDFSPVALVQSADGSLTWEADASAPSALSVTWAVRTDRGRATTVKGTKALAFGAPIALEITNDLDPGHYLGTVTLTGAGGATEFDLDFVVAGSFSSKPSVSPLKGVRSGDGALYWTFAETVPEAAKVTGQIRRGQKAVFSSAAPALRDGDPVVLPWLAPLDPGTYSVRFLVRSAKNGSRGVDYVTPSFTVVSATRPGAVTWKRNAQGAPFWTTGLVAPKGGATLTVSWGTDSSATKLAPGDPVAFSVDTTALKAGKYALKVTISPPGGAAHTLGAVLQLNIP